LSRMKQGEIWWASLPAPSRRRPVVILTRSAAIASLSNITVAPLTRTIRGIQSEVRLTPEDGVPSDCVVSLENILTIPKSLLDKRITTLGPVRMTSILQAIRFVFDMD
jgi:mRNA interferase MazF